MFLLQLNSDAKSVIITCGARTFVNEYCDVPSFARNGRGEDASFFCKRFFREIFGFNKTFFTFASKDDTVFVIPMTLWPISIFRRDRQKKQHG